ncbi:MAG: hypothetical protein M0Z77_08450 [Thermoplasmatales archaeon]|jgi:hypothetical protein|nr:hypothetical protein [Candidatus Thermoplasmatota archaeon]MCL6002561.1 hypothetical protein [Candidatus Thermoplasmatota archaeon]MDA8055657.1 hypothetical protein [Thermoplasmatales archaeon]
MTKLSDRDIYVSAKLIPKAGLYKRRPWERLFRRFALKDEILVGDSVDLAISIENNSGLDFLPGKITIFGFINEQDIYLPTVIEYPLVPPHGRVEVPIDDALTYRFIAFKPGVVKIKLQFHEPLSFRVLANDEVTGRSYVYNSSNLLTQKLVHDNLEVYTLTLLYSTVILLAASIVILILGLLHL